MDFTADGSLLLASCEIVGASWWSVDVANQRLVPRAAPSTPACPRTWKSRRTGAFFVADMAAGGVLADRTPDAPHPQVHPHRGDPWPLSSAPARRLYVSNRAAKTRRQRAEDRHSQGRGHLAHPERHARHGRGLGREAGSSSGSQTGLALSRSERCTPSIRARAALRARIPVGSKGHMGCARSGPARPLSSIRAQGILR